MAKPLKKKHDNVMEATVIRPFLSRLPVCDGVEGIYFPSLHLVVCKCGRCGTEKQALSEWEKHTGSKSKNWKTSRVKGSMLPLEQWMLQLAEYHANSLSSAAPPKRPSIKERMNPVFHTFSNTGWLTYVAILERFPKQQASLVERIKGCIVDSAPVAAPDLQVWASGFSAAFLKKQSVATKGTSGLIKSGMSEFVVEAKHAATEAALLVVLEKIFEVILNLPAVNRQHVHSYTSTALPTESSPRDLYNRLWKSSVRLDTRWSFSTVTRSVNSGLLTSDLGAVKNAVCYNLVDGESCPACLPGPN